MAKREKKHNLMEYFPKLKKRTNIVAASSILLALVLGILIIIYVNIILGIISYFIIFLIIYMFLYVKIINKALNKEFEEINKIMTEKLDFEKYYETLINFSKKNLVSIHKIYIESLLAGLYIYQNRIDLAKEFFNNQRNILKVKDIRYYSCTSNLLFCSNLENNKEVSKLLYEELCCFKKKSPINSVENFTFNKAIYELIYNSNIETLNYLENFESKNKLMEFEKKYFLSEYYIKNNEINKAKEYLEYLVNQPYNIFQELAQDRLLKLNANNENNI